MDRRTSRRNKDVIPRCRKRNIVKVDDSYSSKNAKLNESSFFSIFPTLRPIPVTRKAVDNCDDEFETPAKPVVKKKGGKENKNPQKPKNPRKPKTVANDNNNKDTSLSESLKAFTAHINDIHDNVELNVVKDSFSNNCSNPYRKRKNYANATSDSSVAEKSGVLLHPEMGTTSTPSLFDKSSRRKPRLPIELQTDEAFLPLNEPVFENSQICINSAERDELFLNSNYSPKTTTSAPAKTSPSDESRPHWTNSKANRKIDPFADQQQRQNSDADSSSYQLRSRSVKNVTKNSRSYSSKSVNGDKVLAYCQNFSASGDMFNHCDNISDSQVPTSVLSSDLYSEDKIIEEESIYNSAKDISSVSSDDYLYALSSTLPANQNVSKSLRSSSYGADVALNDNESSPLFRRSYRSSLAVQMPPVEMFAVKNDELEDRNYRFDCSMKSVRADDVDDNFNELRNVDDDAVAMATSTQSISSQSDHDDDIVVVMETSANNTGIQSTESSYLHNTRSVAAVERYSSVLLQIDEIDDKYFSGDVLQEDVDEVADLLMSNLSIEKFRDLSILSRNSAMMISTRNVSRLSFADICSPHFFKNGRSVRFDSEAAVFEYCQQEHGPISWDCAIPTDVLEQCVKIGEGTYGEVFKTTNLSGDSVALKIIPIEGGFLVNDERQKNFEEILPEILIAKEMSELRKHPRSNTPNFVEVKKVSCVQGCYPDHLLNAWDEFKKKRISVNDRPDVFNSKQLFIVFEFGDGGTDLENFSFTNVDQAKSVLLQTTLALAVAEKVLDFEHRDLHIGNILVKKTKEKHIEFKLDDKPIVVKSSGVHVYIIDFTNSRLYKDGCVVFTDLSDDESMFTGEGDIQFDTYRYMRAMNNNEWKSFQPKSNLLWMRYLAEKLCVFKKYKGKTMSTKFRTELNENFVAAMFEHSSCNQFYNNHNTEFFQRNILNA